MSFVSRCGFQRVVPIQNLRKPLNLTSNAVRSFAKGVQDVFVVLRVFELSTSLVWKSPLANV
jgi:hypothetical protein